MPGDPATSPSFSALRKWSIGFNVVVLCLAVLAVGVMVNYLSRDYFLRFHVGAGTRAELSPRTMHFVRTLTNEVKVTLYYDTKDAFYGTISELLNEYHLANSKISVETVDYLRDPGTAQKVKAQYKLSSGSDTNLIIFDCVGKGAKPVPGSVLAQYTLEQVPNDQEREWRRRPVAFLGETYFTAALLAVTSPKPLTAYFLQQHYEHAPDSDDQRTGYLKFAGLLQQNYIHPLPLSLLGTNAFPADCDLLIIAGPKGRIQDTELEKIEAYLNQGGRLLALFNAESLNRETGLEKLLAKWGVQVGNNVVADPEHSEHPGADLVVSAFSKHPLVNPVLGSGLYLVQPRTISRINLRTAPADAPHVEEIAFAGQNSFFLSAPGRKQSFPPVMAVVEKGAIKGMITQPGTTRMVVAGDSLFLANNQLGLWANRDFAGYAVNWLVDRPQLMEGVGPRPVREYRLVMTRAQLQSAKLILLAGMPGGALLLGGLVWLRRRR